MHDQGSEMQDEQDEVEPQLPVINSPVAKSLPILINGTAQDASMFNQNFLDDPANDPQSGSLTELTQKNDQPPAASSTQQKPPSSMHILDITDGKVVGKGHTTKNSHNKTSS